MRRPRVRSLAIAIALMIVSFLVPPAVGGLVGVERVADVIGASADGTRAVAAETGRLDQLALALNDAIATSRPGSGEADRWAQIDAALVAARSVSSPATLRTLEGAAAHYGRARRLSALPTTAGRRADVRRELAAAQRATLQAASQRQRAVPTLLAPLAKIVLEQRIGLLVGIVSTFLGGLTLALWLRRSVQRPLSELKAAALRIGTVDFRPVDVDGLKDFAPIVAAFNSMAAQLSRDREELRHRADHDVLTGLPNRAPLCRAIDAELESGGDFCVLYIDLDGFKEINDTHGHAAGDKVLVEVAARLKGSLRPTDPIARLGGDEFVVVLPGATTQSIARCTADRLRMAISAPIHIDGHLVSVGASIGVATAKAPTSAGEILSRADQCMYAAKQAGRTRPTRFSGIST